MKRVKSVYLAIFCFALITMVFAGKPETVKAAVGDSMRTAIPVEFDEVDSFTWTGENSEGNLYLSFETEKRGAVCFAITKPLDEAGNVLNYAYKIYSEDGEVIWSHRTRGEEVVDEDGNPIVDKENPYSHIVGLMPGKYYMSVELGFVIGDEFEMEYAFSMVETDAYEVEPNDTKETATLIDLNKVYDAQYMEYSDNVNSADWFKFKVEEGEKYRIEVGNAEELFSDTAITDLIYSDGEEDWKWGNEEKFTFVAPASGYTYIGIWNDFGPIIDYSVSVTHLLNGVYKSALDNQWYYYIDNEIATKYTGLARNSAGWWYVKNGKVDFNYTGLCKYGSSWYYVNKGMLKWNYTGLCKYGSSWYYVGRGVVNFNYTGLCKHSGSWFYVKNGVVNFGYTGLCKYNGSWYYVKNGVLNWNYTGLCKYGSSWYYVNKGVLNWNATGLCKYGSSWYYVQKGVVNFKYTGLCKHSGSWFYVKSGVVNFGYTGLCYYGGSWYYVKNGILNWNYTGLCKYGSSWYYVNKGVVNFKYTGYTNYGGARWYVRNGVMAYKA